MTGLWTQKSAALATGGVAVDAWTATGVSIDSRTVQPGDLFVALRGENHDAHAYVGQALQAGAVAAVVDRVVEGPHLLVPDTMQALEDLGRVARARTDARVAAITGSVGKTSSKEALTQLLSLQAPTYGSRGNLNNNFGVPLSLARLPEASRFGVFELGMNHPGEIAPLARQVRPHVAVVTAIAPAHVEFFADGEMGIAREKASIAEGLDPGGTLILPRDSVHFPLMSAAYPTVLSFGTSIEADSRLLDWQPGTDGIDTIEAEILGQRRRYRWGLAGQHQALNSLAVLTALVTLGGNLDAACAAGESLRPVAGRGERLTLPWQGGTITLLDESYNASPAAVRAALSVLATLPGRRVLVLGDMLELGTEADALHAGLADAVEATGLSRLYLSGPHTAALAKALPVGRVTRHAARTADLIETVTADLAPGDAVLVKGSLGMKMRPLVEALRTASQKGLS
ncbi:MAG: UDP-N-acetylmuramoyl-tripeptide--D-alanyl-D-alanine ligase [Elstera sp.]